MLLLLETEFDSGELSERNKVSEIIKAITNAKDFDEEACRDYLERIEGEGKSKREADKSKLKLEKKRESEKLKLEHEAGMEQERLNFELEKIKIQFSFETMSLTSNSGVNEIAPKKVNFKDLVPRFDSKQIDVTLFFMIFQRQAEKEN